MRSSPRRGERVLVMYAGRIVEELPTGRPAGARWPRTAVALKTPVLEAADRGERRVFSCTRTPPSFADPAQKGQCRTNALGFEAVTVRYDRISAVDRASA
jgi:ABC-type dipeptide/oligopeptide/nickel transport system ATPase component